VERVLTIREQAGLSLPALAVQQPDLAPISDDLAAGIEAQEGITADLLCPFDAFQEKAWSITA
jgi:hypothetical protein